MTIKLEDLPLGEYWIKEVEAPQGYRISNEVITKSSTL